MYVFGDSYFSLSKITYSMISEAHKASHQAAAYTKDSCDKRFTYGGWGYKKHEKVILEALGME